MELARKKANLTLDLPIFHNYTIVANDSYLADKKVRPLSLSSIKDLRIVSKDDQKRSKEEEKKKLRTLLLASTALAKFRSHARKKNDKPFKPVYNKQSSQTPLFVKDISNIHDLNYDDVFEGNITRNLSNESEPKSHDNNDVSNDSPMSPMSPTSPTSPNSPSENGRRIYVHEGAVKLSSGTSTNERYLFLFNDLLLVAKTKSASTYKLKERIRVSEIWLAHCIDEVTEATVAQEKSFVIGWPTTNYVAAFNTVEDKDYWLNIFQKTINERRELEQRNETQIKISNRTLSEEHNQNQISTFSVTPTDDVKSVIKMAIEKQPNDETCDYQLWLSSKDALATYPLIGHELPYSIKKYISRNIREHTYDENDNHYENAITSEHDKTCLFTLKRSKKSSANRSVQLDLNNAQKKWKKNPMKKSPIINWAMNKKVPKSTYSQNENLPPGRLFGNPLSQLSTEEELIPKPIQDILTQLFRKGPTTTGIFRKSALQRTVKQVRQLLDTGKEVELSEKSSVVLATVLKEFFRSLPDCLICSELYEELLSTKSLPNNQQRIEQIKRLFERLPKEHYNITMKFTCALYHIQRFSDRNNMNSYNLSICVSPSIMWPPSNIKIHYGEQTSGSSDFVCFLIDNYLEIFSHENEYILGNDSDIEIDDGPGEDSDSGNDQVIYNCQCPQYSPKFTNDVEDESENELTTPVLSPHEVNIQSAFAHSDSSIGTNESDDKTNFRYNMPNISLMPDKVGISKSSPSSPSSSRHNLLEKNSAKSHSDLNECDVNEHYQRKLLKQNRHKRVLSSTTTSAELIEHKRVISDTNNNSNLTENKFNTEQTSFQNGKPFRSLSDTLPVVKKQVISQPIIQHFATEFYATPNVIFHSVDRRRQPAAPSYEEHIQKTQRQRPAPTTPPLKPVMKGKGRIIQHVDDYQATSVTALIISEKEKNSLLDNRTTKQIITTKQENFSTNMKTVSSVQSSNFAVRKISHQNKLMNSSIVPNNSTSTSRNFHQINDINLEPSKIEIAEVSVVKSPIKINRLPVAPKPILKVARKVEVVTPNYYEGSSNSRHNERESSTSTSSISTTLSACSTSDLPDSAFLSAPNSPISLGTSPQSNSPFLLKLKNDDIKKDTSNDFIDENKGQSLHLQKTMLTKAPKKIDQLTARVGNEATPFRTKHISSRELKRTKIRLRTEVRDAFNDGYFVCNNNREDRKHHIAPKTGSSLPIKGMKMTLNGQVNDNRKIKSPWLQNNNNKENIAKLNEKNFIEKKTSDDGYHGGDGYTKEDESYV